LFFAVLVLGTGALVTVTVARQAAKASATIDAAASDAGVADAADATAPIGDAEAAPDQPPGETDPTQQKDAGGTLLLSGEAPPGLAAEAPKSVVFGVVLVTYRGAQGAPTTARSRDEALKLVKELGELAKTDFKAAVGKGDKGSMDNAGRLPRGVLEPAPEYVLFSLPKGGVSEPVDTPRGYWIVQRVE
jgi:hypothetical protein